MPRIRFMPRNALLAVGFAVALAAPLPGAEVPFAPAALIAASATTSATPGDVDGDGDLDLVAGGEPGAFWVENVGGAGAGWLPHMIDSSSFVRETVSADVDRDGDLDAVASLPLDGAVVWHENLSGNGASWARRTIATAVGTVHPVAVADMDRDGDPDVVSASVGAEGVYWHENVAGNGTRWVARTVVRTPDHGAMRVADVDRDGDIDVLTASVNGATVAWHENLGGGAGWAVHTIDGALQLMGMGVADVDGDGDVDVVGAPGPLGPTVPIFWLENADGGTAWTRRTIAVAGEEVTDVTPADLDGDGDVDLVAIGNGIQPPPATSFWYENTAGDGSAWTRRLVGAIAAGSEHAVVADIDGDGDADVATVSRSFVEIAWLRNQSIHRGVCFVKQPDIATSPNHSNTAIELAITDLDADGDADALADSTGLVSFHNLSGNGASWSSQLIGTSSFPQKAIRTADLDGDGDVDFVSRPEAGLIAFRNAGGGSAWVASPLSAVPSPFTNADTADLDGDGDADVVAAGTVSGLRWFENGGNGTAWTLRLLAPSVDGPDARAVDLEGDGDLDVVARDLAGAFRWLENVGGASGWLAHTISGSGMGPFQIGDLDGDGDPDLLSGMSNTLVWLENPGTGAAWPLHTVETHPASGFWLDAGDLDGDGDLDGLATVLLGSVGLVWYDNAAGDGSSWTRRPVVDSTQSVTVGRLGDLDSDGDADVLTAQGLQSRIGWARNDAGQVRFDLEDQVPPSANNNDVFSMLRLAVTHLGRAGDSDVELGRIGLLFRGDAPLSSAQANALVEELRVYRDANGNGTFDPGTDTLVTTVPTLALTNGVQTIALTDGDPDVQVVLGTPATFFVVAQLTANASEQAPNLFRVTHLATGASATRTEDRSADVALLTACPADFQSRIIGPVVPVELLGFTVE